MKTKNKIKKLVSSSRGEILFTDIVENLQPYIEQYDKLQNTVLEEIYAKYNQEHMQLP